MSGYDLYHQLEAESYTGDLLTNIFAGGTVDSERCFLTGNYQLKNFRAPANSHLWYLRDQGYTVEGSHPYYQWFYNRQNINQYLGFERFRYLEGDYENLTTAYLPEDGVLLHVQAGDAVPGEVHVGLPHEGKDVDLLVRRDVRVLVSAQDLFCPLLAVARGRGFHKFTDTVEKGVEKPVGDIVLGGAPAVEVLIVFHSVIGFLVEIRRAHRAAEQRHRPLAGGGVSLGFSLGNYFKLQFRDDPLYFEDMLVLREAKAMTVEQHYNLFIDKRMVFALVCLALGTAALCFLARGRLGGWKKRLIVLGAVALVCGAVSPAYLNKKAYDAVENYEYLNRTFITRMRPDRKYPWNAPQE